jgi:hypothetical protein
MIIDLQNGIMLDTTTGCTTDTDPTKGYDTSMYRINRNTTPLPNYPSLAEVLYIIKRDGYYAY